MPCELLIPIRGNESILIAICKLLILLLLIPIRGNENQVHRFNRPSIRVTNPYKG